MIDSKILFVALSMPFDRALRSGTLKGGGRHPVPFLLGAA